MKLAINGGPKVRTESFQKQKTYEWEEVTAVVEFMKTGKPLSSFRGNWQPEFWGGQNVQMFEKEWANLLDLGKCLAVNSCTSALQIACGAIGLVPWDEVIVTPWSMTCSATAPMIYGAVPVFADIDIQTFCLHPDSIEEKITPKTKAIIVVDLFGHPFDYDSIRGIADKHGLYIIEDAAQAPGARYSNGMYAGSLGDIGCFSFTAGKHLTCGEGGIIATRNPELYMKCALIRNHAESVINAIPDNWESGIINKTNLIESKNMVGFNMRMTELHAIIMREQLKRLFPYIISRDLRVKSINNKLSEIPCILPTITKEGCEHAHYVQGFIFDSEKCNDIHRDKFISAVTAELSGEEGRPDRPMLGCGYIKPLYRMPLFEQMGYKEPMPVCELLYNKEFFLSMYHNLPLSVKDVNAIEDAFTKVYENREELR